MISYMLMLHMVLWLANALQMVHVECKSIKKTFMTQKRQMLMTKLTLSLYTYPQW